jgi:hypothetical protein
MGGLKLPGGGGDLMHGSQYLIYNTGDDGDSQYNAPQTYTVISNAGTSNIDVAAYAGNTISFNTGTKRISDSANGMGVFTTGDTIRVIGSVSNDGVYTVSTGGQAGYVVTTENLVLTEGASPYIILCKRATPSNNCVKENNSNRTWRRAATNGEKIGTLGSTGLLVWYDSTKCYTIHPAAADLAMNATTKTLTIVGGASEANKYYNGQVLEFSGFAVANNNRTGGYPVVSVTVNSGNLDIVLWTGFTSDVTLTGTTTNGNMVISGLPSTAGLRIGMAITGTGVGVASTIASIDSATQITGTVNSSASATVSVTFTTLATETAAGSRSIKVVCNNIFAYAAMCNAVALGGYSDWRIPSDMELANLRNMSTNPAVPDATAFPTWPTDATQVWSSTKNPKVVAEAQSVLFTYGDIYDINKTTAQYCAIVRGH